VSLYLLLLQERYGVAPDVGLLWYLDKEVSGQPDNCAEDIRPGQRRAWSPRTSGPPEC
jgi:hypothetical protein